MKVQRGLHFLRPSYQWPGRKESLRQILSGRGQEQYRGTMARLGTSLRGRAVICGGFYVFPYQAQKMNIASSPRHRTIEKWQTRTYPEHQPSLAIKQMPLRIKCFSDDLRTCASSEGFNVVDAAHAPNDLRYRKNGRTAG